MSLTYFCKIKENGTLNIKMLIYFSDKVYVFFSELEIVIRHLIELKQSVKTILALLSNENKLHPGAKKIYLSRYLCYQ